MNCIICNKDLSNGRIRKCKQEFYCDRHYRQMLKHGHIIKTRCDPNEIVLIGKYAEIILNDINNKEIEKAKIDLEDIEKIKNFKWFYDKKSGYVCTHYVNNVYHLHQIILGDNYDHIDRNKLNNLKENLRPITKSRNMMNSNISTRNKTGVKGVSWDKSRNKWTSHIRKDNKTINIGRFSSFDEAVKQRMIIEAKLFNIYSAYHNKTTNLIELTFKSIDTNTYKMIKINMNGEVIYFE